MVEVSGDNGVEENLGYIHGRLVIWGLGEWGGR